MGFFQAKAKARARSNRMQALKNSEGALVSEQDDLEEMANNIYKELFTVQADLDPALVCQHIPRKITTAMAETLDQPFTPEGVEKALFQMGPNKALGPDGLTTGFFQRLKEPVVNAVLGFLNWGMSKEVNQNVLVYPKSSKSTRTHKIQAHFSLQSG
jgi:hypothetical protein